MFEVISTIRDVTMTDTFSKQKCNKDFNLLKVIIFILKLCILLFLYF